MVATRMSRRCRRYSKQILRVSTKIELQTIASLIQSELDKRILSYDEALTLGNLIQNRADQLPGDAIVYALSDRDAYRRTLELYLRDSLLTQTEQMLLEQLLLQWRRQGKKVTIDRFKTPGGGTSA